MNDKEKEDIVKKATESIERVANLRGYSLLTLPKDVYKMMLSCYIEGVKMALEKHKEYYDKQ